MADEVVNPVPVTIVDAPVEEAVPVEFVHPGQFNGYDVLDLTAQYNQSHEDYASGYFRVTCLRDTEINRDVVTDAPSGPLGEVTDNTKAAIERTVKELEAVRKGK